MTDPQKEVNCCKKYPHIGILVPLHPRLKAIRNDECHIDYFYQQTKILTTDQEANAAKNYLTHGMMDTVYYMIVHAVFFVYMGYRSANSLIDFFFSLYGDFQTTSGKACLKSWLTDALKLQENRHYSTITTAATNKKTKLLPPVSSSVLQKSNLNRLVTLINKCIERELLTTMDCMELFCGETLEVIGIIPSKERFERRMRRLPKSFMSKQIKTYLSGKPPSTKAYTIVRHYILATMDLENIKYGYAVIPLSRLSEFEAIFRSYLNGDDPVDSNLILDIMLDLFMDEIEYNHIFWVQLIKRCRDMTLINPLPLDSNDDDDSTSNSQAKSQQQTDGCTLAHLLGLKFEHTLKSDESTSPPPSLIYVVALLADENMIFFDHLLPYIVEAGCSTEDDNKVITEHSHQQQRRQQQQYGYLMELIKALLSLGNIKHATCVKQYLDSNNEDTMRSLHDWILRMVDYTVDSLYEHTQLANIKTTAQPPTKDHPPALTIKYPPRTGYYLDDSDDDDELGLDNNNSSLISCDSFSTINTNHYDETLDDLQNSDYIYDFFNKAFFCNTWKDSLSQQSTASNLKNVLKPLINFLNSIIDSTKEKPKISKITVNKIISILHYNLTLENQFERQVFLDIIPLVIFPSLVYDCSLALVDMMSQLSYRERSDCYTLWLHDTQHTQPSAITQRRQVVILRIKEILEDRTKKRSNELLPILHSHPVDFAYSVLSNIHLLDNHINQVLLAKQYLHPSSKIALDAFLSLAAFKMGTYNSSTTTKRDYQQEQENQHTQPQLPNDIISLCSFTRYLIKEYRISPLSLKNYLVLYPRQPLMQYACLETDRANSKKEALANLKRKNPPLGEIPTFSHCFVVAMTNETKIVVIIHRCFECPMTFSTPRKLRHHLQKHNIQIPQTAAGIRRYNNQDYTYVKSQSAHASIENHFGCPACIVHCVEVNELKAHFYANHSESLSEQQPLLTQTQQESDSTGQQSGGKPEKSSKRRSSNALENELLDPLCLSFPPPDHDDHLVVQNFDATMAFHKLQLSLTQHKWKLSLENHIHCAMAATSILLLSRNQYPDDLSSFFSKHDLDATIDSIETKYNIRRHPMSMETSTNIISIIQDLTMRKINRDKAFARLLDLNLPTNENKFKKSIIELIRKLPPMSIAEDTNEYELGTRYIDPFLCGLFDDPDEGMYLRWTNEITLEARKHENLSMNRPDICITRLHGVKWTSNHGFGEAKSASHGDNHFLICQDLLRTAIFCKNALDTQNMEGVLGLQIIGRMITFYVLVLPSTGLYVMYELEKIKIPSCLDDLAKLVMDMPRVLRILDVFNRICNSSVLPSAPSRHRPTIITSIFNRVFSSSQNRKRSCHLKYRHN
ncbi:uncharacterized protein BX664DRAFT_382794 [Halteromyces radiatus]|uniref:uncharacterized protein n=1 Tax=Halteromyces radiatus TaxID=101107 RepID=UPI00221E39B1|nr:uncharacterized protein BX664DRAFT_382794 [Halteromyces radiatus]KAI8096338.1 hypothetical protein BX664DRAFT_382794 [Halteromyces radiatus]